MGKKIKAYVPLQLQGETKICLSQTQQVHNVCSARIGEDYD